MSDANRSREGPPPAGEETPFYIPATGQIARPRRTLKHGDTFAVVDSHGDLGLASDGADGVFHRDTRYISRLELLLNGMPPLLLGSSSRDDNVALSVDLTNPDIYFERKLSLPKDAVHINRTIFLWCGTLYQRLGVANYGDRRVAIRLAWIFANDFADIFEVRGMRRHRRGATSTQLEPAKFVLTYDGVDGRQRTTAITFDPVPEHIESGLCSYPVELAPGERCGFFVISECNPDADAPATPLLRSMHSAFREVQALKGRAAHVHTSNALFNQFLSRSVADLAMLVTETREGIYPYAGVPWYSTTFGRDGIITALQVLWCNPGLARGVLRRLAAYQAKESNAARDSQPGKILHEMRGGEMAALQEVPFGLYYGAVDSTPLFIILAGEYVRRTGDLGLLRDLWPNIQAALNWIDSSGDPDGDGFVEYQRATEFGLVNQGWKDSQDAVFHADGALAEGPIALVEVQAYVYYAKQLAAECAQRLGQDGLAVRLREQAERLAERFAEAFWCPSINSFALALDGHKRPCEVRTSNAGQVLFTGIARPEHSKEVGRQLLAPSFFSGWGVRTVATDQARYNPMSYHNGSVWPHDNALIARGLARCGLKQGVETILVGLFEAANYMEFQRLPELFCGFRRGRNMGPTLYPVACAPQAWSCVAPFALLEATLGLEFDPDRQEIRLRNPRLPPFLHEILISDLRLGQSSVDLLIRGHEGDVSLQVVRSDGTVRVSVVYI